MLSDLLSEIIPKLEAMRPKGDSDIAVKPGDNATSDSNDISPKTLARDKATVADPGNVYDDAGNIVDYNPNPFANAWKNSKSMDGSIMGFVKTLQNMGQSLSGGDVGGTAITPSTPGITNPTPSKNQPQPNLASTTPSGATATDNDNGNGNNIPLPQPRPLTAPTPTPDPTRYAQPSALDPVAIEQLRQSLLGQAGQLDPSNPNGLAGRMSGPNSKVEQQNQMRDATDISNSLRPATSGSNSSRPPKNKWSIPGLTR